MNHNVISGEDLKQLLLEAYWGGLDDGTHRDKNPWDNEKESYFEFLNKRGEDKVKAIVESTGKYRIK